VLGKSAGDEVGEAVEAPAISSRAKAMTPVRIGFPGNFPFEVTVFSINGFLAAILTQGVSLTRLIRLA